MKPLKTAPEQTPVPDETRTAGTGERFSPTKAFQEALNRAAKPEYAEDFEPFWEQFGRSVGQLFQRFLQVGSTAARPVALPPNSPYFRAHHLLDQLPVEFSRKVYWAKAQQLGIPGNTADKYIRRLRDQGLLRHSFNRYVKTSTTR